MIRNLIFVFLLTFNISVFAQDVSISRVLDAYAYCFDDENYLIIEFKDGETHRILGNPTMLVRLTDGEVIKLHGPVVSSVSKSFSVTYPGKLFDTHSSINSIENLVMFAITPEQVEAIKKGIIKISINTVPRVYTKTFTEDVLGMKLYDKYVYLWNCFF